MTTTRPARACSRRSRLSSQVDYEGMLPEEAGNYGGEPNERMFRQSVLSTVDPDSPTGITLSEDFFVGPTAEANEFTGACYEG